MSSESAVSSACAHDADPLPAAGGRLRGLHTGTPGGQPLLLLQSGPEWSRAWSHRHDSIADVLPEAGHFVHLEHPACAAAELAAFFARGNTPAAGPAR